MSASLIYVPSVIPMFFDPVRAGDDETLLLCHLVDPTMKNTHLPAIPTAAMQP
jgi:hypothetical protein